MTIKKKKGSFVIAAYSYDDCKYYLQNVDGYLFNYKGYEFGMYKAASLNKYRIIDLNTGRMIFSFVKFKDLELRLCQIWNSYSAFLKTTRYLEFVENKEYFEIDNTKESMSLYCWRKRDGR